MFSSLFGTGVGGGRGGSALCIGGARRAEGWVDALALLALTARHPAACAYGFDALTFLVLDKSLAPRSERCARGDNPQER